MPQGLGQHTLHFRSINLPLFLVAALLMLEGSPGTHVPDYGYLHKHWKTLARGLFQTAGKLKKNLQ